MGVRCPDEHSFSELIVFFLFDSMRVHIYRERRSKAILLSREEYTIVLVVLLLFLLSFLCNKRSSCWIIIEQVIWYDIYNHFFFFLALCLSLDSLRWHIHSNSYWHLISNMFSSIIYHHLILNTPPFSEEWVLWDIWACDGRKVRHVVACLITVINYLEGEE